MRSSRSTRSTLRTRMRSSPRPSCATMAPPLPAITADLDNQITNIDSMWSLATPSYSDQVLPFNVTLSGANEYGAMTCGKILGIEILVIDQVFPSFRPVCHRCNLLPDSTVKSLSQSILALVFLFIWLAGSRQKRLLPVAGCPGAVVSPESAEIDILGVNSVRKSARKLRKSCISYLLPYLYLPDKREIEGYKPSWARAKSLKPSQPNTVPGSGSPRSPPASLFRRRRAFHSTCN